MVAKRRGQPDRERQVPKSSALRDGHMTLPVRTLHAELPLLEVDVAPFERHHLAAPQARVAAQKHNELRRSIECLRGSDQPLVLERERPRLEHAAPVPAVRRVAHALRRA